MTFRSRVQLTIRRTALAAASIAALYAVAELAALTGLAGSGPVAPAQAQRQGLSGGGQGTGSGGASGGVASPQGAGAGGSTAGAGLSNGSGNLGSSQGPGPVNQNRYGGRPSVESPPPPGETTTTTNTAEYYTGGGKGGEGYLFGRADRCADFKSGRMTANERIGGANLERLNAAQHYMAPGFDPLGLRSALYLLANYQQELEKGAPDALLAGTYLGLVSTQPVTPKLIDNVNLMLCITAAPKVVDSIAATADEQRRAQVKGAGTN